MGGYERGDKLYSLSEWKNAHLVLKELFQNNIDKHIH